MESKGVIYYNRGEICLPRLIVSLMTLRQHYSGSVTVFLDEEHPENIPNRLKSTFGVEIVYCPEKKEEKTLLRKVQISATSPYDLNVWIDSDTVILGIFDELFEMARDCDIVVTQLARLKSNDKLLAKRIRLFQEKCSKYIEPALTYGPMINTGVYAWRRGSAIFPEWLDLAEWGSHRNIVFFDETSCQVLLPRYNVKLAPSKYNISARNTEQSEDLRIVHYCTMRHTSDYRWGELWRSAFTQALRKNVCGIRELTALPQSDAKELTKSD